VWHPISNDILTCNQIFSLKAEEFKTTVTSLLGWKFRFQQNGAVQLTSVYDPNALIVFSQPTKSKRTVGAGPLEGEDIKVQLIAETAPPEVGELYRTWVAGFGCVPGFLGSLTVQLYEASPEGAAKLKGPA
jgi:mitotic spindle assembly checkpoint protein MAD1